MSNPCVMGRDAQASVRLPTDLKRDIEKVAKATSRTLSSTMELLLRRGVEQFKQDGLLIEIPSSKRQRKADEKTTEEELAHHMADLVADRLFERLQQQIGQIEEQHKKQDAA